MSELEVLLSLALAAVLLTAAVLVWRDRRKTRRILTRLDGMLEQAMRGDFREEQYDESLLSAVESAMARYLSASAVSARNLGEEKAKIQSLIADISHQTKTPIANLLLYAQLLAEQPLTPEGRRCASALEAQAEKLQFLIGALVKTSRLETGILTLHPKTAPVQPLMREVCAQLTPRAAEKGLTLTAEGGGEEAVFDPKWTAEALYNLADNAVKYTPPGGRVTLSAAEYPLFVRIDVTDTGVGIPEEELPRIFQRFYRSEAVSETEGVGIGLYLARQIVSGEGGYLKARSEPGKGSTFSLFLPREGETLSTLSEKISR